MYLLFLSCSQPVPGPSAGLPRDTRCSKKAGTAPAWKRCPQPHPLGQGENGP